MAGGNALSANSASSVAGIRSMPSAFDSCGRAVAVTLIGEAPPNRQIASTISRFIIIRLLVLASNRDYASPAAEDTRAIHSDAYRRDQLSNTGPVAPVGSIDEQSEAFGLVVCGAAIGGDRR